MAKLKIKRPAGFFSHEGWRVYGIVIDGKQAGEIHRGKEAEFDLPAGEHRVRVTQDWAGSHTLTVTLAEGHEKVLSCRYSGNGAAALISPDDYLILEEEHKGSKRKQNAWETTRSFFKIIPVTMCLILLLTAIFTLEMCFNIGAYDTFSPNLHTLVALGGLYHPAILQGEWNRLFSPVLLHASVIHLLFNCYALLLAGIMLENMVGRVWYLAIFAVGGIGGSLMALAINPDTLVSVGASGAIMALFAAALVCSFHLPKDANRKRFQMGLVQILVVALIPFIAGPHGQRIDVAGHLGGAVTGAVMGGFLLLMWRHKTKPGLQKLALGLCLLFAAGYAYSALPVVKQYPAFQLGAALIPQDQVPTTDADAKSRAKDLVARYPGDPRAHYYMAMGAIDANDMAGAEKELRLGLDQKEALKLNFAPALTLHMEGVLALVLQQRGDTPQAKGYAKPLCSATSDDPLRQSLANAKLCE